MTAPDIRGNVGDDTTGRSDTSDSGERDRFDEPLAVAAQISSLTPPTLLVLDCDGVLAPLVDHADDAVLLDGTRDALVALAAGGTHPTGVGVSESEPSPTDPPIRPAVLSGRSLSGLAQFDFPSDVLVLGSYGGERRGHDDDELTATESARLTRLREAADAAATRAGPGAWVEQKPGSVVLHVRQAEPVAGREALHALTLAADDVDGAEVHHGSNVVELMARPNDKGSTLERLRSIERPGSMVYIGDDQPDEAAFAVLGPGDVSVKVGPGASGAARRLADPAAVRALLRHLADLPPIG